MIDACFCFASQGAEDVAHVRIAGFRIAHTATTQLKPYEVPSGGDWAIGRYAAVTLEGASHVDISGNHFDRVGGNAIGLFNRARNNTVEGNR